MFALGGQAGDALLSPVGRRKGDGGPAGHVGAEPIRGRSASDPPPTSRLCGEWRRHDADVYRAVGVDRPAEQVGVVP